MDHEEFYNRVKIGDEIPPLEKQATLEGFQTPEIFGGIELANGSDEAKEKAMALGVDAIHTSKVFGGVFMLQFISEMITNWLPSPKYWVQGGRLFAKFVGLVKFNELIMCRGKVKDKTLKDNKNYFVCDVWIENASRDKVVIGEVQIPFS